MNRDPIVIQALQLLECQVREADTMTSPQAVKDYLSRAHFPAEYLPNECVSTTDENKEASW